MKWRATDNKNRYYAGRGIGIEKRWLNYRNFSSDMLELYKIHVKKFGEKNTTIERVDNNQGYCKKNCRFATHREQWRNKRNNRLITYQGKALPLSEWSRKLGITPRALHYRLTNYSKKWSFSTPKLDNKSRNTNVRKKLSNKIQPVAQAHSLQDRSI